MTKSIELMRLGDLPVSKSYPLSWCKSEGELDVRYGFPGGYSQWIIRAQLATDATISWSEGHVEEAILVVEGEVAIDGRKLQSDEVAIVGAGATPTLRALGAAEIAHFGSTETSEPGGRADVYFAGATGSGVEPGSDIDSNHCIYADGSVGSESLVFFKVWGRPGHGQPSHSHSADELIHVVTGSIRVGPRRVAAGDTIAVPADQLYGFRTDEPWGFVNYRPTPSTMTYGRAASKPAQAGPD